MLENQLVERLNKVGKTAEQIEAIVIKFRAKNFPKLPHISVALAAELKNYISKFDAKDIRFMYFKVPMLPNNKACGCDSCIDNWPCGIISVVTILDRINNSLRIGFSFCDARDDFNRVKGKVEAFRRIFDENNKFTITVPWVGDGLFSIAKAWNTVIRTVAPRQFRDVEFKTNIELVKYVKQ